MMSDHFRQLKDLIDPALLSGNKPLRMKSSEVQRLLGNSPQSDDNYKQQKTTKTIVHHEDKEQEAIFEWRDIAAGRDSRLSLLFAIPNGGLRNAVVAMQLKRQGVKSGVCDMFLPVAMGGYHGLFIELKAGLSAQVSANQRSFILDVTSQGYYAVVCHGAGQAINTLEQYLQGEFERETKGKTMKRLT